MSRFVVFGNTLDGFDIQRGRHVIDHSIQKRLDTLVLESSSSKNGNKIEVKSSLTNKFLQGGDIWFFSLEVCHEHILVLLHSNFDELLVPLLSLGLELVIHERNVVTLIKRNTIILRHQDPLHAKQ